MFTIAWGSRDWHTLTIHEQGIRDETTLKVWENRLSGFTVAGSGTPIVALVVTLSVLVLVLSRFLLVMAAGRLAFGKLCRRGWTSCRTIRPDADGRRAIAGAFAAAGSWWPRWPWRPAWTTRPISGRHRRHVRIHESSGDASAGSEKGRRLA